MGKAQIWRRDEKVHAIQQLRRTVAINSPCQKLWFAVVEQAISDIGARRVKPAGRQTAPGGPVLYVRSAKNSDSFFTGNIPSDIFEDAGLDWSFVLRELKIAGVLPVPAERYTGEKQRGTSC